MRVIRLLPAPAIAAFLAGCGPAPVASTADPSTDAGYVRTVQQLQAIDRDADSFFQRGRADQAAALIEKGQPLEKRVLAVPHPPFDAAAAASDLDDLYGRMLLSNHHYGWARLLFQKNFARWKHWAPATAESGRRLKQAVDEIAECDKHLD
jgi:hypothetical protein